MKFKIFTLTAMSLSILTQPGIKACPLLSEVNTATKVDNILMGKGLPQGYTLEFIQRGQDLKTDARYPLIIGKHLNEQERMCKPPAAVTVQKLAGPKCPYEVNCHPLQGENPVIVGRFTLESMK